MTGKTREKSAIPRTKITQLNFFPKKPSEAQES